MTNYTKSQWLKRRQEIFAHDSWRCVVCGRTYEETELQVHHSEYLPNRPIWDYPDELLITLCKGCHAREHGLIMPQSGWEYVGYNDLGELSGECECCGAQLRYEHWISHPSWGHLTVGEGCANRLTGSEEASQYEKDRRKRADKLLRYINSPRWRNKKNGYFIELDGYSVQIWDNEKYFRLVICFKHHRTGEVKRLDKSKKKYKSLDEAKIRAYQVITSGELEAYIKKHYD